MKIEYFRTKLFLLMHSPLISHCHKQMISKCHCYTQMSLIYKTHHFILKGVWRSRSRWWLPAVFCWVWTCHIQSSRFSQVSTLIKSSTNLMFWLPFTCEIMQYEKTYRGLIVPWITNGTWNQVALQVFHIVLTKTEKDYNLTPHTLLKSFFLLKTPVCLILFFFINQKYYHIRY